MTPAFDPHPHLQQLAAFDAGLLRADQREAIEEHVADCAACCRILEELPEDALAVQLRGYVCLPTLPVGATRVSSPDRQPTIDFDGHGRYRILDLLGEGGMGVVYRAHQCHLDRTVAVKVLHRRLTDRPGFVERFQSEVKTLARLHHPNIVAALDADCVGGSHFLVMEYIEGENLEALVRRRGALPVTEAIELVRRTAMALQHAHEHGMVHRDVKPQNLLLATSGALKVVDFGLARLVQPTEMPASDSFAHVVGTPDFMAPEQARNPQSADVRSDLYALGCTFYFLLTGSPPFARPTALQILLAHQDEPPPSIRRHRRDVPAAVEGIIQRLLSKNPEHRFAVPAELVKALAAVRCPTLKTAKTKRLQLGMVGAFLCAAVVIAFLRFGGSRPDSHSGTSAPGTTPAETVPEVLGMPREVRKIEKGPLASADELAALKREKVEELLAWLRKNNRVGPQSMIVDTLAGQIEQRRDYDGYRVAVGGGLLHSGRPTLLIAGLVGFHEIELTEQQAEAMNLGPRQQILVTIRKSKQGRRFPARIELSDLQIDDADHLTRQDPIRGTIRYSFPVVQEKPACLRVTAFPPTGGRTALMRPTKIPIAAGQGTLSFTFGPLKDKSFQNERWLILYAEWVTMEGADEIVESNTAIGLICFEN